MIFPKDLEVVRRTKSFSAATMPAKLGTAHDTAAGVWARIVVELGSLTFTDCRFSDSPVRLGVGAHDRIEPQVAHFVTPDPDCVFHLELLRRREEA